MGNIPGEPVAATEPPGEFLVVEQQDSVHAQVHQWRHLAALVPTSNNPRVVRVVGLLAPKGRSPDLWRPDVTVQRDRSLHEVCDCLTQGIWIREGRVRISPPSLIVLSLPLKAGDLLV